MKRMRENRIKYRAWVRETKAKHGDITSYIYRSRLGWTPVSLNNSEKLVFKVKNTTPFADPEDYKIMWNDWPYGSLESDVKHLIVWLKQPLQSDPATGRLLESQREIVQAFVDKTFLRPMRSAGIWNAKENLRWFKNGLDLQSVKAIDHFHVLVKGVPEELLFEWTHESEPVV
jgi:hypothetical protein